MNRCTAFLTIVLVPIATSLADFEFRQVAKTGDQLPNLSSPVASFGHWVAINETGQVAFKVNLVDGSQAIVRATPNAGGEYDLSNQDAWDIVDTADGSTRQFSDFVAINNDVSDDASNDGTVSYRIRVSGTPIVFSIHSNTNSIAGTGSPMHFFSLLSPTDVALAALPEPAMVSFIGIAQDGLQFRQQIRKGNGVNGNRICNTALIATQPEFISLGQYTSINDNGQVAFYGSHSDSAQGRGVFVGNGAVIGASPCVQPPTPDFQAVATTTTGFAFPTDARPSINNVGQVAFCSIGPEGHGVYLKGAGSSPQLVVPIGAVVGSLDFSARVTLNDIGDVAFVGTTADNGARAIFRALHLASPSPEVVLRVGDDIGNGDPIDLLELWDGLNANGQVAFWAHHQGGAEAVHVASERCDAPPEGGVRASIMGFPSLMNPVPTVSLFRDMDGNCALSDGETSVEATRVAGSPDLSVIYFTPPPYDYEHWGLFPEEGAVISAIAENGVASTCVPDALRYTDNVLKGVNATGCGLKLYHKELMASGPDLFMSTAPTAGAIAEVILYGLLNRAEFLSGGQGSPLAAALEGLLPHLRDYINITRPIGFGHAAVLRPITFGQTLHTPFRHADETVLLTLGTGTLTLKDGEALIPYNPPTTGRFILPVDLPQSNHVTVEDAHGWDFDVEVDPMNGVEIVDVRVYRPDTGLMQFVSRRLSVPTITANVDGGLQSFNLVQDALSHIYIHDGVQMLFPGEHETLTEWVLTAVYRLNLDGSPLQQNVAKPALVVRQSYALTETHQTFEPSHCLTAAQTFPRVSVSLSIPVGTDPIPVVTHIGADHRIALAPQAENPDVTNEPYVAGFFKDVDDVRLWIPDLPLPCWPDPPDLACTPLPFWFNMFNTLGTTAPVTNEMIVASEQTDNIHFHHVHPDHNPFWIDAPLVEAPGSFDGTFHLHWRWGTEYGASFGSGVYLMPLNQTWLVGLARHDFPLDPQPTAMNVLAQRIADSGGQGHDILTQEKVLLLYCSQSAVASHRQYETLSVGYGVALGVPGVPCACPIIEAISENGGYWVLQLGFENAIGDFFRFLARNHYVQVLADIVSGRVMYDDCDPNRSGPNDDQPGRDGSICADAVFAESLLGTATPMTISAGGTNVHISVAPNSAGMKVGVNMFRTVKGYLLGEPLAAPGSTLTLSFDTPVRELRHLPVLLRDMVGPATLSVEVYDSAALVTTVSVEVAPVLPGLFAEGVVDIDPGQFFDRVVLRSINPALEFAINGFQVCIEPLAPLDLDYDGGVDIADFAVLNTCLGGPELPLGTICADSDLSGDSDVDLHDVALFQRMFGTTTCPGDINGDCHVGQADFSAFVGCFHGPEAPYPNGCAPLDFDLDGDVDMADFAPFQTLYTGD